MAFSKCNTFPFLLECWRWGTHRLWFRRDQYHDPLGFDEACLLILGMLTQVLALRALLTVLAAAALSALALALACLPAVV